MGNISTSARTYSCNKIDREHTETAIVTSTDGHGNKFVSRRQEIVGINSLLLALEGERDLQSRLDAFVDPKSILDRLDVAESKLEEGLTNLAHILSIGWINISPKARIVIVRISTNPMVLTNNTLHGKEAVQDLDGQKHFLSILADTNRDLVFVTAPNKELVLDVLDSIVLVRPVEVREDSTEVVALGKFRGGVSSSSYPVRDHQTTHTSAGLSQRITLSWSRSSPSPSSSASRRTGSRRVGTRRAHLVFFQVFKVRVFQIFSAFVVTLAGSTEGSFLEKLACVSKNKIDRC